MSQKLDIPFNIKILDPNTKVFDYLKPVTSATNFDGMSKNFTEDGLFSIGIFGRVGSDERNTRYSYIDIKVPIFHPLIYRVLGKLKQNYHDIIEGRAYAIFDEAEHDFIKSDAINGQTGYQFFLLHWKKIQFKETNSTEREFYIKLVKKYQSVALTSKVVVEPAGLRDMYITKDGRNEEDEVNDLYRKLMAVSNTVNQHAVNGTPEILNVTRCLLQSTFNAIFLHFESMLRGKKKMIQGKWAARRIQNGTRNVITAMNLNTATLGATGNIGFNNTGIGLYQFCKAIMPIACHDLRAGLLTKVFPSANVAAQLVNRKTLRKEAVEVPHTYFDRYMTNSGLEKVIKTFSQEDVRHRAVEIQGHYLGLIFRGEVKGRKVFKIFQDIDELPKGMNRQKVFPLSFAEWLYLSVYQRAPHTPIYVTRYPVASAQSIYPSFAHLKSTTVGETRVGLNDQWEIDEAQVAFNFPIGGASFINSLIPHPTRIKLLNADYDGDTCSSNALYSDEAIKEVQDHFRKRRAYVDTEGRFLSSTNTDTVALVLHNMTGATAHDAV